MKPKDCYTKLRKDRPVIIAVLEKYIDKYSPEHFMDRSDTMDLRELICGAHKHIAARKRDG